MPSVNLMFPKQYFGHQDPQFSSITLLVAELYHRNHLYYLNGNQGIDQYAVSFPRIVTGICDSR